MIGILPLFVVLLIIVSFGLVVAVPVILATPGEWERSQGIVWSGAGVWSALVVLTGIFNYSLHIIKLANLYSLKIFQKKFLLDCNKFMLFYIYKNS